MKHANIYIIVNKIQIKMIKMLQINLEPNY